MRFVRTAFAGSAVVACLIASPPAAHAAPGAQVFTVIEGRDTTATSGAGREYLVLIGAKLTTIRTIELRDAADADAGPVGPPLLKSATMFVVALPDGLAPGKYDLVLTPARGTALRLHVNVTYGAPPAGTVDDKSLAAPLKQKVDDSNASTLGGLPASSFRDASNLATGTMSTDLYSAIADLVAEGKLGTASDQVAKGDHEHDARYPLKTDLAASGQVNLPTNPVDWSKLKNVPSNFVTGAGEGLVLSSGALALDWAGFAGDLGVSTKPSRSDHAHDARYFNQAQLSGAGTLNTGTNPVDWTKLKNVPAGFADGTDDTGTAGLGLKLASGVFSADFAGTGLLNTVARSDHDHDSRYFTQSQTSAVGTINLGTNPVDWTKLKGVPSAFADGVDDVGSAGTGLSLAGSTLSVIFGGNGAATNAARSDHNHDATYAPFSHNHDTQYYTQSQLFSVGTINTPSNPVDWSKLKNVPTTVLNGGTYSAGTGLGLAGGTFSVNFGSDGTAATAARSDHTHGNQWVLKTGDTMSSNLVVNGGSYGVQASGQVGVFGSTTGGTNIGVWGLATSGIGTYAECTGTGTSFIANHSGGSGNLLQLQNSGTAVLTIAKTGAVTTSGGLSVSGTTSLTGVTSTAQSGGSVPAITAINTAYPAGVAMSAAGGTFGLTATASGYSNSVGVAGQGTGTGVQGIGTTGVYGSGSVGVFGTTTTGNGVYAECTSTGDSFIANHSGGSGNLVQLRNSGTAVLTIAKTGAVTTSGGLSVSGTTSLTGVTSTAQSGGSVPAITAINTAYPAGVAMSAAGGTFGLTATASGYSNSVGVAGQGTGTGVQGIGTTGVYGSGSVGVFGTTTTGNGVYAECTSTGDSFVANHSGGSGSLAVFRNTGTNVARIDKTGKGFFNGGTQASGADFAESVAVKGDRTKFEAGDVIVVDPDADRGFAMSGEAESTLVAGVYSTKPALLGTIHDSAGMDDSNVRGEIPLGVVGICPTKVCDEGGPIKRGDLLVTASLPGYAKKAPANVKPGTILGKALGALAKGRGKIEVLISLQ